MTYVEFLRARRAFAIFAAVLAVGEIFAVGSIEYGKRTAAVNVVNAPAHEREVERKIERARREERSHSFSRTIVRSDHVTEHSSFSVSVDGNVHTRLNFLTGIAAFLSIVLATILSGSLSKENDRGGFAFTKPVPRTRLALGYMAIDVATILAGFVFALGVLYGGIAFVGAAGSVTIDRDWPVDLAASLGVVFMWYGTLQAATSMRKSGAGLLMGLSWPVFAIGVALYDISYFGDAFHGIVAFLDFFNPLAYENTHMRDGVTMSRSIFELSTATSLAITWGLAFIWCVVAILGWKRQEV